MSDNLRRIQTKLKELGFDPGPADGEMGPRTRLAIQAFQKSRGLLADGIVGPVTIGALFASFTDTPLVIETVEREDVERPSKVKRPCHTLVWHCTATPEGKEFSRAQIRAMHLARGFSDIGYHQLIHLDGSVSPGRSEDAAGSHVAGHNTGTLGYSYIGGVDHNGKAKDTRTAQQKATMTRLTRAAIKKYGLRAVLGHRDLSPDKDHDGVVEPFEWVKICPCFNTIAEYGYLLKGKA